MIVHVGTRVVNRAADLDKRPQNNGQYSQKSQTGMTASVLKQDPKTGKVQKNAIYLDKNHNMQIFGVIPFIEPTLKQ